MAIALPNQKRGVGVAKTPGLVDAGKQQGLNTLDKTTVIVPTFNRAALLAETLDSILAQTLAPAEIIVADDGSTDDTPARMAAYAGKVQYIRKENSGKADTLNRLIPHIKSPLVWIVDDDDIVLPHALEKLTGLLRDNPQAGFAYGPYNRFIVDAQTGARKEFSAGHWRNVDPEDFLVTTLQDFFAHHPGLLVRKECYDRVGPFSMNYSRSEDYEMLVRLARANSSVSTRDILFLQRQHDDPRVGGLVGEDARHKRWQKEERDLLTQVREDNRPIDFLPRRFGAESILTPQLEREALIVRAAILARKKLWAFAAEDFASACAPGRPATPLNAREIAAIRQSVFSKYGFPELLQGDDAQTLFLSVRNMKAVGAQIARTYARALLWFVWRDVQSGRLADAARIAAFALQLAIPSPGTRLARRGAM
ncbi:MAG: glycosyltransferase [Hyphomonas sp.]|nr:glycosyltransferase [Hyphomonas sp.]